MGQGPKKSIWIQVPLWVLMGSSGIWGSWVFNYYRIAVPLICLALMSVLAFYAIFQQRVLLKAALPAAYVQNSFYLNLLFIGLLGLIGLLIIIN